MDKDERIAELEAEVERLTVREAHAIEYERCITWDVTCSGCAHRLDAAYRETMRAEAAEARLDAVRARTSAAVRLVQPDHLTPVGARQILAALDSDATASPLREEFALAYERKGDPAMDNPSGISTHRHVLPSREAAEKAVAALIPGGSRSDVRDRRVERRLVTEWERLD